MQNGGTIKITQKKWEELLLYMNMKKKNSENKNT